MRVFRYRIPLHAPIDVYSNKRTTLQGWWLEKEGKWAEVPLLEDTLDQSIDRFPNLEKWIKKQWELTPIEQSVSLNVLGQLGDDLSRQRLQKKVDIGYSRVKLKVGRQSIQDDIRDLTAWVENQESCPELILDANKAWSLTDALTFAEQIAHLPILYIEEPTQNSEDSLTWAKQVSIPLAWDESLREYGADSLTEEVAVCVLKPFLPPFIFEVPTGKQAVISSAYESLLGLTKLFQLAQDLQAPAGLDTMDMVSSEVWLNEPKWTPYMKKATFSKCDYKTTCYQEVFYS